MIQKLARFIILFCDWTIDIKAPANIEGSVLVVAPHTSNWDFFLSRLTFLSYGKKVKMLIKKEAFVFPVKRLLIKLGGIAVDRKKKNNISQYAVSLFKKKPNLILAFTPEGTRSYNKNWKLGFYHIAKMAKVKIYLCYIDYSKKMGGFGKIFKPTDNLEEDIKNIKSYYKQFKAKYPEKTDISSND